MPSKRLIAVTKQDDEVVILNVDYITNVKSFYVTEQEYSQITFSYSAYGEQDEDKDHIPKIRSLIVKEPPFVIMSMANG